VPQINPSIPILLQPDSTEEPKVQTALTQLVATINALDATNLVANAVTAAKMDLTTLPAAQQAWQTVALGGGGTWTPASLYYFKDSLGMVHLRGDGSSFTGTVGVGATLATLPAGYRPVSNQTFALFRRDTAALVTVIVRTDGVIINDQALAAGAIYTFGAIHFRAEL
jgi:hypothetical protein